VPSACAASVRGFQRDGSDIAISRAGPHIITMWSHAKLEFGDMVSSLAQC